MKIEINQKTREWLKYCCGMIVGIGCSCVSSYPLAAVGLCCIGFFGSYLIPEAAEGIKS